MNTSSGLISLSKQWIKRIWACLLYYTGIVRFYSHLSMNEKALVLMYHRVLDENEGTPSIHPGMYVTRKVFSQHLEYLSKFYTVVTLEQLEEWFSGKRQISGIPCLITFDDGWADNYDVAFPLLQKYSLPAAIFLITDQIGEKGMLTWPQAREMESFGISFGSHTVTHAVLKGKNHEEIRHELRDSQKRLQKELSRPSDWFCYPKGEYDQAICAVVREFYSAALTTQRGPVSRGDDLFQMRRVGIHNDVSMTIPLFACMVTSLF